MKEQLNKKIVLTCFLASFLEIYDFVIFGFFAPVLHKNYLIFLDQSTATLASYALFAVGFLFRPLGSLIFGYIGDVYGRKISLVISVSIMGTASLIMFILPSYNTIGILSCYIIIFIRILQGISVGGEFTGALVFAVEHCKKNVGFVAGIITAGGACGALLANFVCKILQHSALPDYSWRFAFLVGFGLSIVGFFIRRRLTDTPVFQRDSNSKIPLLEGFKHYKTESFATFCVSAANGTTFYFGSVFLGVFIKNNKPEIEVAFISTLVSITVAVFVPIFGFISDFIDRKKFLMISSLVMGGYSLIALNAILKTDSIVILAILVFLYAFFAAMMIGSINIFAIEIFPVKQRMSCSSLFYSLGMGVIGGTVPIVSSYIIQYFGMSSYLMSIYIAAICFMSFLGTFLVYKKQQNNLLSDNTINQN